MNYQKVHFLIVHFVEKVMEISQNTRILLTFGVGKNGCFLAFFAICPFFALFSAFLTVKW